MSKLPTAGGIGQGLRWFTKVIGQHGAHLKKMNGLFTVFGLLDKLLIARHPLCLRSTTVASGAAFGRGCAGGHHLAK